MTTHIGSEGSVAVGANAIGEVTAFSYETSVEIVPDGALGDTWDTHKAGSKKWSGSVSCNFDPDDTNGQAAMTEGASVTLNLYPEGSGSGANYVTGTVTISNVQTNVNGNNEITSATFDFVGNGAATRSTVV